MKVMLFIPCLVDRYLPEAGIATQRLLEAAGCQVTYDSRQTCCGQPAYNAGHADLVRKYARRMLALFDGSVPVVSPSGSCVAMVRDAYGELGLSEADLQRWQRLRGQLFELSEFLVHFDLLPAIEATLEARVAVHHSCHHLRHLDGRTPLEKLLKRLSGVTWLEAPEATSCCGFGGVFSMKLPELSVAMGSARLESLAPLRPDYVALADAGCILHLRGIQEASRQELVKRPRFVHYAQLFTGDGLAAEGEA